VIINVSLFIFSKCFCCYVRIGANYKENHEQTRVYRKINKRVKIFNLILAGLNFHKETS